MAGLGTHMLPIAVMLPDVLVDTMYDKKSENLAYMINRYNDTAISQTLADEVAPNKVNKYGIVDLGGESLVVGQSVQIPKAVKRLVIEDAPSNLSIMGRYVFSPKLWDCLRRTPLGVGDKIQLTDAIDFLMLKENVEATLIVGKTHDCGSRLGYLQTNFLYAPRREDINNSY